MIGRDRDRAALQALLGQALERGGALLLSGEPGVGKTALLDAVVREIPGYVLVSRVGARPADAGTGFATLRRLLLPVAGFLGDLAPPARTALDAALSVGGPTPDRLVVSTAVVTVLRRAAERQPVLAVVDGDPALDPESAGVLGFVARRLVDSRVALLAAGRTDDNGVLQRAGLPVHEVLALSPTAAAELLARDHPAVPAAARAGLQDTARGNPLALDELATAFCDEQSSSALPSGSRLGALRRGPLPDPHRLWPPRDGHPPQHRDQPPSRRRRSSGCDCCAGNGVHTESVDDGELSAQWPLARRDRLCEGVAAGVGGAQVRPVGEVVPQELRGRLRQPVRVVAELATTRGTDYPTKRAVDPLHALNREDGGVTSSPPALRLIGLTKTYGSTVAADAVDLTVPAGSFSGVVGPNGAGKTTALSMAVGLLRPDSGTAEIFGVDVWADPSRAKTLVGVLPDGLAMPERLTGREVLTYLGALQPRDDAGRAAVRHRRGARRRPVLAAGRLDEVRAAGSLEDAFVALVGADITPVRGLSWLSP